MAMSAGAARSPWVDVLVTVGSIAVVSAIAVVRGWDLDSWILTVTGLAVAGIVSSVDQARRNRRIDLAAKQAREWDGRMEFEQARD